MTDNSIANDCKKHDWPKVHELDRTTCGPYGITQYYFDICKEADNDRVLPTDTKFRDCALNETCARDCVKLYVQADQTPCGRSEIYLRKCIDYSIIHANRHGACDKRTNTDVIAHAATVRDTCKVDGLARIQPIGPTKAPPEGKLIMTQPYI